MYYKSRVHFNFEIWEKFANIFNRLIFKVIKVMEEFNTKIFYESSEDIMNDIILHEPEDLSFWEEFYFPVFRIFSGGFLRQYTK
ncbi:unnamed protein product [Larinioides sclopetarius]|uniref:Uncharacterized protein n=1 Tax=Larinioides sclopetarius TaxID=280406 RepID=A0AAV2BLV0_9ARAC